MRKVPPYLSQLSGDRQRAGRVPKGDRSIEAGADQAKERKPAKLSSRNNQDCSGKRHKGALGRGASPQLAARAQAQRLCPQGQRRACPSAEDFSQLIAWLD